MQNKEYVTYVDFSPLSAINTLPIGYYQGTNDTALTFCPMRDGNQITLIDGTDIPKVYLFSTGGNYVESDVTEEKISSISTDGKIQLTTFPELTMHAGDVEIIIEVTGPDPDDETISRKIRSQSVMLTVAPNKIATISDPVSFANFELQNIRVANAETAITAIKARLLALEADA